MDTSRLDEAIRRFDAANADDPKEVLYARRMTERLERLAPDASEVVRLAARAQHIRRWEIPRDRYPRNRQGYRAWRTDLARYHAETAAAILTDVGYDEPTVRRVGALLRKERLKTDPEAQLLEDVVCLVFLEHYLADFALGHDEEKLIGILRKTWGKMSERGHDAAARLELAADVSAILQKALED